MLSSGVLVLNRSFLPVHITTVRRAFVLLYQGIAKAVDTQYELFDFDSWAEMAVEAHKDEAIGLVGRLIKVPRVILLTEYDRLPRRRVRFSRHPGWWYRPPGPTGERIERPTADRARSKPRRFPVPWSTPTGVATASPGD